ncbi:MAG: hypothetical protein J1F43_09300, partial [Muribaculaceae bacterium]|nr:hypothetical protein [Muribaculaceae bacterium]
FYGQAYNSEVLLKVDGDYCVPVSTETSPVYQRKEKADANEPDSYELVRYNRNYIYAQNMFFPRMYSDNPEHKQAYENWMGGVKGRQVTFTNCGRTSTVKIPTMAENLYFFMSYQMNFMYWRYFMWNFAGRQNDIQGHGELEHGNWVTGLIIGDWAIKRNCLPNCARTKAITYSMLYRCCWDCWACSGKYIRMALLLQRQREERILPWPM